jgi:uncharacterized membrane protein YqaE (UPF0057 family)
MALSGRARREPLPIVESTADASEPGRTLLASAEPGGREVCTMVKVLLVLLCLFLPFLAVLIKDGPSMKVLWAFLLQLCGHIPGVIYGIYQVVKD